MTDKDITYAARQICSEQVVKADNDDWTHYLSGRYDHTVLMRLVEQGIRRGLEWQTMVKTQHCPNCESIEQKLHNFRQEVSDAVLEYYGGYHNASGEPLERFIITKPPTVLFVTDPLAKAMAEIGVMPNAGGLRDALDALGFEIREKANDQ